MGEAEETTRAGAMTPEHRVLEWWKALESRRGDRAELRRSVTLGAVPYYEAHHDLYRRLSETKWRDPRRVALIAGVVSHVKEHASGQGLARRMGGASGGENALVSGLRFRRLIQVEELEDLYPRMIRILRQLGGRVDVEDLARTLYWWSAERTRHELASVYYQVAPTSL